MSKLNDLIAEQQRGHEGEPRYMIGEQLKEIAEREELSAELLERDLEIGEMSLEAAEKRFEKYADENHGKAKVFCITPVVAEQILREFYGLPKKPEKKEADAGYTASEKRSEDNAAGYIDLSSFL